MTSVQRSTKVNINNSNIELLGIDIPDNVYNTRTSYTFSRIDSLTSYNNTILHLRRGFNIVKEYNSLKGFDSSGNGILAQVDITENGEVTKNVDNRIFVLQGINLVVAKEEISTTTYDTPIDIWGNVNGMTYFGMYNFRFDGNNIKYGYGMFDPEYTGGAQDEVFFSSSYVEGKHKANHDKTKDGFYTNGGTVGEDGSVTDVKKKYIDIAEYGLYQDWIIGEERQNFPITLIASNYSYGNTEELQLRYEGYQPNTTFAISRVNLNVSGANLISPTELQNLLVNSDQADMVEIAHSNFALTMESSIDGWAKTATTGIYTKNNGVCETTGTYQTDNDKDKKPSFIFKLHNLVPITNRIEIGTVNLEVVARSTTVDESGSSGKIVILVININLRTMVEEETNSYNPKFTDNASKELYYTNDAKVDISYKFFKTGYTRSGTDYRAISSNKKLPSGTKITMLDKILNRVYYLQITSSTENTGRYKKVSSGNSTTTSTFSRATSYDDGSTRYLYRLSEFTEMGCSDGMSWYRDDVFSEKYYNVEADYNYEDFEISIDFINSNITQDWPDTQVYLELRDSKNKIRYDQHQREDDATLKQDPNLTDPTIRFNLYANKNAIIDEDIIMTENSEQLNGQTFSLVEELDINCNFNGTFKEQTKTVREVVDEVETDVDKNITDSKYHARKAGFGIEVTDEAGSRVDPSILSGRISLIVDGTDEYLPDANGVIRFKLADTYSKLEKPMKLHISKGDLETGTYRIKLYFFAADDGKYFGLATDSDKDMVEFNVTVVSSSLGFRIRTDDENRIFYKDTLEDIQDEKSKILNMKVEFTEIIPDAKITATLYKRKPTLEVTNTGPNNEILDATYNTVEYELIDYRNCFTNQLQGNNKEYIVDNDLTDLQKQTVIVEDKLTGIQSEEEVYSIDFDSALKEGIETGEYKLELKMYSGDLCVETVHKTFVVIE